MRRSTGIRAGLGITGLLAATLLWTGPAAAHHMMGGRVPGTLAEGLLSGLGHPVIGLDHLSFILGLGIAAALVQGGPSLIAAFVACSAAGVMLHVARLDVPLAEPMVAVTILVLGAALIWSRSMARPAWLVFAIAAGLLHGYAFGESIVGAERTVLGAYLVGLAIISAAIAAGVMALTQKLLAAQATRSASVRVAGAVLGCFGAALLAGSFIVR